MIAFVEGVVRELREASVVLAVSGFGVEVYAPASTLAHCRVGETSTLRTYLVVREEQPVLYGFHHGDQLLIFRRLLEVGGVGPKLALAVLSAIPTALIATAVANQDAGLLTSAPGVGKRTAERIVLELKDRLPESLMAGAGATVPARALAAAGEDAVDALIALGYRESQVKGIVAELAAASPEATPETLIRKALARLR
ncbi:MAG: Holliday junction branch migration protein RuvA [Trueperaceae bacterium]